MNDFNWRHMDERPLDQTVLVTVEPTEANETFSVERWGRNTFPAYIDSDGVICDPGTWKPDKGLHGQYWRSIAWMPLPEPAQTTPATPDNKEQPDG